MDQKSLALGGYVDSFDAGAFRQVKTGFRHPHCRYFGRWGFNLSFWVSCFL